MGKFIIIYIYIEIKALQSTSTRVRTNKLLEVVNSGEQCCGANTEQCCAANTEQCYAANTEQWCGANTEEWCGANTEQCCAANTEQWCGANTEQWCGAYTEQCCAANREQCCQQTCSAMITMLLQHCSTISILHVTTCYQGSAATMITNNKQVYSILILFSTVSTTVNNRCCFINAKQHC